jgi:hypothetical protein
MSIQAHWFKHMVVGALALLAAGQAAAQSIAAVTAPGNWSHGLGQIAIPGMLTPLFANAAGQRFIVTFSSECAVDAPAGDINSWLDVDIVVLDAAGAVVATLPPTAGNADAYCAANGSLGFDGWTTQSVTAVGGANLPAGNYRVQVLSRVNLGATGGWHGERALVVWR